jgi:hypothetical protein
MDNLVSRRLYRQVECALKHSQARHENQDPKTRPCCSKHPFCREGVLPGASDGVKLKLIIFLDWG